QAVSKNIRDALQKRASDFGIVMEDTAITHLSFSREYTAAVEAKQVAQQDSERAKYVVEKARQEKMSIVIKAQGEAQSAKLVGDAIKDNPGFIQLRRIDAARDIASTVARYEHGSLGCWSKKKRQYFVNLGDVPRQVSARCGLVLLPAVVII
ncbi:unnamed protein product, partial [Ectocarpus sp. 12 AP-2014]